MCLETLRGLVNSYFEHNDGLCKRTNSALHYMQASILITEQVQFSLVYPVFI